MTAGRTDLLNDDISRLERHVFDLEAEMRRDEDEVARLQGRLHQRHEVLNRLRRNLADLWELRVAQHRSSDEPRIGVKARPAQIREPMDPTWTSGMAGASGRTSARMREVPQAARSAVPLLPDLIEPRPAPSERGVEPPKSSFASEIVELAGFLATVDARPKDFGWMARRPDGTAPDDFASAVRQVAHRSIARAGRPLDRNAIFDEVKAANIPIPNTHAKIKVSKILARDRDLKNRRGEGYSLTFRGLLRQLWQIRAETQEREGSVPARELWDRWGDVDRLEAMEGRSLWTMPMRRPDERAT